VYIESSYRGHKAAPGKYSVILKMGEQKITANAIILANPLYATDAATYKEYHTIMNSMETALTSMHQLVNSMNTKREQLEAILAILPGEEKYSTIKKDGVALVKKMKAWDEGMVQRKSKAYDDAENFENKFTANYLFLINQTESDIPRVNQPSMDRMKELNAAWAVLKNRADEISDKNLPALNKLLWEAGVGAVWKK
jgi:ATP phosphoribosyltransferase